MKKIALSNLFHKAPTIEPERSERDTQAYVESLTLELATAEIDTRFREALRKGETMGDAIMIDEHGNPIEGTPKRKNILGL